MYRAFSLALIEEESSEMLSSLEQAAIMMAESP
jgi:hypothetical protein